MKGLLFLSMFLLSVTVNESVIGLLNSLSDSRFVNNAKAGRVTLEQFGAKGDGVTDDTQAITKALNSLEPVIYASKIKAFYKVSNLVVVTGVTNKRLIATGAKILNSDLTKATFLFQNSRNIQIEGGTFGYATMPTANGGNSQHVFQFEGCQSVLVNKIHIINSPEMGIAITNSNRVTVQNSIIEHTFRDGTYSHYSANVKYLNNTYNNIKDDAMSFHDYGIVSEKSKLIKFGYYQATNLVAQHNTVLNAYQGFGSIGANGVKVINNKFKNTVLAAIAVFNSKELYANGTSLARNAQILNNSIEGACSTVIINNQPFTNNGQASTGRAAIFVGSLGTNNQLNAGETKRLKNIVVSGNNIANSRAHGFFGRDIDNLRFLNNSFSNCSGAVPAQSLSGDIIELGNITNFTADNNAVIDTRPKKLHQHGYALNNVAGQMGNWNVKGVVAGEKLLTATQSLRSLPKPKQRPITKPSAKR
ncbi:right-handed parallel beta-helix repeat-containing protein [Spirosoma soli]|uniref:Right-handed parallel beta-helix repeat-containing protein n=1 Tax=Spirosoma soli TaxID=1770529 RepID=A0ABW5M574_9BACT